MLTRPSKDTIHFCDIRIKAEEKMYWNHIPSLSAQIYSTANPKPTSMNCIRRKLKKGYLSNPGLLRLKTGCAARRKYTTVTVTQINKRTKKYICNPNVAFNITAILPKLDTIQQCPKLKPFTWEKPQIGSQKKLHTDESLLSIEEQLTELEEQNFNKQVHNKYWTFQVRIPTKSRTSRQTRRFLYGSNRLAHSRNIKGKSRNASAFVYKVSIL